MDPDPDPVIWPFLLDPDPDPAIIPGFRIRIQAEKKEESKTKSAKKRVSKSLQRFKRYMNNSEVLDMLFNKNVGARQGLVSCPLCC